MRVAIYAPVSTTNEQSPEMQLSDLREYAPGADGKCSGTLITVSPARKNRAQN